MKLFLLSTLIAFSSFVHAQSLDCEKFKFGNYVIPDSTIGNTLLQREGNKQFEYVEKLGVRLLYKVKWLDECTYTLQRKKIIENPTNIEFPKNLIVKVEILETREKSYLARISTNLYDLVLEVEIHQIE